MRPVELFGLAAAFQQRHDVDAVGFQHRARGEREFVQPEIPNAVGDRGARPRQEARAHPVGNVAQPQVEACRLDLVGREGLSGTNPTARRKLRDHVIGQDALVCLDGRHETVPRL
jgi:hypothetical protein